MRRAMLDGRIEVKVYRPERFDTVFVELEHFSRTAGRYVPSGVSVTQSDAYAFVGMGDDDETILGSVLVPTEKLRSLVAGRPVVQAARASANPTRGVVLSIGELLRQIPATECSQ